MPITNQSIYSTNVEKSKETACNGSSIPYIKIVLLIVCFIAV